MADENWLEILNWNEDNISDLRYVGYSYVQAGKYDIALSFFKALEVLANNNFYDLQTIGAIYLQQGDNLKALEYFDKALNINVNHYPTILNKAKALFSLGYKKQAIMQAEKLLNLKDKKIVDEARVILNSFQ